MERNIQINEADFLIEMVREKKLIVENQIIAVAMTAILERTRACAILLSRSEL